MADEGKPIFIVGCSRSGTTLLRLLLTCHPDLCIPPESPFILKLHPKWGNKKIESFKDIRLICRDLFASNRKFRDWGLAEGDIEKRLNNRLPLGFDEFIQEVYGLYMERRDKEAIRWGDKNPGYVHHIGLLSQLFPDAQFIHIIRDGRAVFHSFIHANRKHGKIYPETPFGAAIFWKEALTSSLLFKSMENYMEIHYEDLVLHPESVLRSLCGFLQVSYLPEEMFSYPEANAKLELVPRRRLKWHGNTLQNLDKRKPFEWKKGLKHHQVLLFELFAGNCLKSHGFTLLFPFSGIKTVNEGFVQLAKWSRLSRITGAFR